MNDLAHLARNRTVLDLELNRIIVKEGGLSPFVDRFSVMGSDYSLN